MSQLLTRNLSFESQGHTIQAYAAYPEISAGSPVSPAVIVLHAWWGLTPIFKRLCDRLAQAGFAALAPDLYGGITASTIEEAQTSLDQSDYEYSRAAVSGAVKQIRHLPGVTSTGLGVVGFSMGAAWALALSTLAPQEIAAVVLFYGASFADFSQSRAAYQGHFAEQDEWEPLDGVRQMEADMHAAGRPAEFYLYPQAGHWFFEEDRPQAYNPEAAELAWQRTLSFLRAQLG